MVLVLVWGQRHQQQLQRHTAWDLGFDPATTLSWREAVDSELRDRSDSLDSSDAHWKFDCRPQGQGFRTQGLTSQLHGSWF